MRTTPKLYIRSLGFQWRRRMTPSMVLVPSSMHVWRDIINCPPYKNNFPFLKYQFWYSTKGHKLRSKFIRGFYSIQTFHNTRYCWCFNAQLFDSFSFLLIPWTLSKFYRISGISYLHSNCNKTWSPLYCSIVEKFNRGVLMHHKCE